MSTHCIACGTTPAYISYLGNCECSNPQCKFYSSDLYPPVEKSNLPEEVEKTEYSSVYLWSTRHNDFGDV
jgi:hypothetical protein